MSQKIVVVAEKPSVARDIAAVVGADRRSATCLKGPDHTVTWALGHLVALAEPGEMRADWKRWRISDLPILPEDWPLEVVEKTSKQFAAVADLLNDAGTERIICATDAGREGELIFRYIYEKAGCVKPVDRLWISSLTGPAIRAGLKALRPIEEYDALADSARARSRADWLVGMNLSRAYSLRHDDRFSVGRVQTPTLAMLVDRELEISRFKPEPYCEAQVQLHRDEDDRAGFRAVYTGPAGEEKATAAKAGAPGARRLPADGVEAGAVLERVKAGQVILKELRDKEIRLPPPRLFDLTELQREANRLYGYDAGRTLEVAQKLYERHKLISYPRTDSPWLTTEVAAGLPDIVAAIREPWEELLEPDTGSSPPGPRFVNDKEVRDHHGIIPTGQKQPARLAEDERLLYELICRRLLAIWQKDHRAAVTVALCEVVSACGEFTDAWVGRGRRVLEAGWRRLDPPARRAGKEREVILPDGLRSGQELRAGEGKVLKKETRPPPRLNDAALLTAMENAGRRLEDRELSRAMADKGLGTPATRAAIIDTLLRRGYAERRGKLFHATDRGIRLISLVDEAVRSPAMTGEWEAKLAAIGDGRLSLATFSAGINAHVAEVTRRALEAPRAAELPGEVRETTSGPAPAADPQPAPLAGQPQRQGATSSVAASPLQLLQERFGFDAFRPHQEEVCRLVIGGRDLLLVMPTGAGKSLCFQLPGIARGGATLVISPLIALIEDQVEKLQSQGFRAERIHSGRDRHTSREVCRRYQAGELDFLFIAPERLGVTGFIEFLAARKPALIAIDEAHCISHWGHDFRPDYRMLGQRLPALRPVPVIAMTATATPRVQEDIIAQLNLENPSVQIRGFRRSNIAIEVIEVNPSRRPDEVAGLLADEDRRPAIVYCPTRSKAADLRQKLAGRYRSGVYHAGLPPEERQRVQEEFLAGQLDVMIATIAFGMGVDKSNVRTVVHTALPGSIENYYQEIGRAGRDGQPSRAVLFHSWADQKTHEFFLEKNYPDAALLQRILAAVPPGGIPRAHLQVEGFADHFEFENALEKLWVHNGLRITPEEMIFPGEADWEVRYAVQKEFRLNQLQEVDRFARGVGGCRMAELVRHFGDEDADDLRPCGICDICAPDQGVAYAMRPLGDKERRVVRTVLGYLDGALRGQSAGRLFRETADGLRRPEFDQILALLVREQMLSGRDESFEKDGRTISWRSYQLAEPGLVVSDEQLTALQIADSRAALPAAGSGRKPRRRAGASAGRRSRQRAPAPEPVMEDADPRLLEELKSWRLREARKRRVPAFVILPDRTITAIAATRPRDPESLGGIKGIGPGKLNKYGEGILNLLREFG